LFYGLTSSRSWPCGARYFFRHCSFFLGAQEGFAVWLDPKVPKKSSQQKGFFAAQGKPHPKSLSKREGLKKVSPFGGDLEGASRAAIILPRCARAFPMLLQKLAMPFPVHKATIVLPAFIRSLPADENIVYLSCHGELVSGLHGTGQRFA
jgi:hypothetical protein